MHIGGFTGQLIEPGDAEYDEARRVWNGLIDRQPAAIARCTNASDVAAAIRYARDAGLPVTVRGGGHAVAGLAVRDGGFVVDCAPLRAVSVDPVAWTVRAQAGCLWADVDRATQRVGRAVPGGIVSHTGIAGLTLGGGIGWLMRKHGLTVDNLLGAEVVSADGDMLSASESEHADLFWALRGGGGNFGVVTSFEYRASAVGRIVLAGPILWALDDAPDVLRCYRDWIATAPDELTTIVKLAQIPALPAIPATLHRRPAVTVSCCYAGPVPDGERVLKPLRRHGRSLLDLVAARPYLENQRLNDPTVPHGWCYYWKSAEIGRLDDAVIDLLVEHTAQITSPRSYTLIFQLGGAVARRSGQETAYGHRTAGHNININAAWLPGDPDAPTHTDWARGMFAALEPHQLGVYVNFLADEGASRVRAAYGERTFARLRRVKRRYDPENVFAANQNIPPA